MSSYEHAIEAAAQTHYERVSVVTGEPFEQASEMTKNFYRADAEAVIAAAWPHLIKPFADLADEWSWKCDSPLGRCDKCTRNGAHAEAIRALIDDIEQASNR